MSGDVRIRSAKQDDLPVLKAFEQGIIAAERPFDHTIQPDPVSYYDIGEMIDSNEAEVAVVEIDGEIVASGYARKKPSRHYIVHSHHAYLGFMYVRPDARGQGLNQLLIDHLLGWAKAKGLTEIRLTVYPGNEPALRAYEKAGFAPYILEMRMNTDE